jgi:sec-independent protein translocase protein TatA
MPHIGFMELVVILAIVVLLFGARRIPDLARGLGEGIRGFRQAVKGESDRDEKDATKRS